MIQVWCSRIDSANAPVSLRTDEMLSMYDRGQCRGDDDQRDVDREEDPRVRRHRSSR